MENKIESKKHIEEAIKHVTAVMSKISDQTTTYNYLSEALADLKTVLKVVYSD